MTANTPQRVDVAQAERLIASLRRDVEQSRGGLAYLGNAANTIAALLQQVAAQAAELMAARDSADMWHGLHMESEARAEAAERAREEAVLLFRKINRFGVLGLALEEEIAAYIAANDSRGQMGERGT